MKTYDVFGEITVPFFKKVKANSYREAANIADEELNDFTFDFTRFSIPTRDGKNHHVEIPDWTVEISHELPEDLDEED